VAVTTQPRTRRRVVYATALALIAALAFLAGWALSTPSGQQPLQCLYPWKHAICGAVSGRVLHVSLRDSDGDGDMHLVLASTASTTGPLFAVVKVPAWRRPPHPPSLMSWVSVKGRLFRGAHGEWEIEAQTIHYAR
jgi:hypothetical protein